MIRFFLTICFLSILTSSSFAATRTNRFNGLNTQGLQDDFIEANQVIKGAWKGKETWQGNIFCGGSYEYLAYAQGTVDKIEFDLGAEEYLDVHARISNGYARINGAYVSEVSFCTRVVGWLGAGVEWIDLESRVYFEENSSKLRVKVSKSRLGRIHLGAFFPVWFENVVTKVVNRALAYTWRSQLGDWLNAKISKYLNEKLPKNRV